MSNSLGLVDFAIRLVNSVLNFFNCPTGKGSFLGNSNYRRTVINPAHQNFFWLVKKTLGLVDARFSLPKWQAVKLTFFAPCKQCFWHFLSQVKRLNTFKELRHSIQTLWKELETVPSTLIGKEMAKEDAETTFKLSSQNMEALTDLNQEVSSWISFLWQWRPSVRTFSNYWIQLS